MFFVCFAVISQSGFMNTRAHVAEVRQYGPPTAQVFLVGLKADLREDESTLAYENL